VEDENEGAETGKLCDQVEQPLNSPEAGQAGRLTKVEVLRYDNLQANSTNPIALGTYSSIVRRILAIAIARVFGND
jgi:hypothetical protein